MNQNQIMAHIDELLALTRPYEAGENRERDDRPKINIVGQQIQQGVLGLLSSLYGPKSIQVDGFMKEVASINGRISSWAASEEIMYVGIGTLRNLRKEIQAGLIGNIRQQISGEVLTDFLRLAKLALEEPGEGPKNVAAVLAAALFEDTLRRLASANGIPHIDKLQEVLIELKNKSVLQGTEIGIANSYLSFRNNALHAQWNNIDRPSIASVNGFVEGLLTKHFS